jgi:hypothetical protein
MKEGTVLMRVVRDREGGRDEGRETACRASGGKISCAVASQRTGGIRNTGFVRLERTKGRGQ